MRAFRETTNVAIKNVQTRRSSHIQSTLRICYSRCRQIMLRVVFFFKIYTSIQLLYSSTGMRMIFFFFILFLSDAALR